MKLLAFCERLLGENGFDGPAVTMDSSSFRKRLASSLRWYVFAQLVPWIPISTLPQTRFLPPPFLRSRLTRNFLFTVIEVSWVWTHHLVIPWSGSYPWRQYENRYLLSSTDSCDNRPLIMYINYSPPHLPLHWYLWELSFHNLYYSPQADLWTADRDGDERTEETRVLEITGYCAVYPLRRERFSTLEKVYLLTVKI